MPLRDAKQFKPESHAQSMFKPLALYPVRLRSDYLKIAGSKDLRVARRDFRGRSMACSLNTVIPG